MRIRSPIGLTPRAERVEWVDELKRSSQSFSTWAPAGTMRTTLPMRTFTSMSRTSDPNTASRMSSVSSPSDHLERQVERDRPRAGPLGRAEDRGDAQLLGGLDRAGVG